jgi:signal transduction histidine kinase
MHRKHQCTGLTQFMQQNQRTILIIDDCIEDRETYRRYLLQDSSYTYTILEEEYGENGLELCTKVKPDAILLDCFLPDINGLQFLSELKKKNQTDEHQIPVVMLTSQEKDAIAAAAIESAKLQAKLINDLLDISRITSKTLHLNRFPVELAVVIESVIDMMRLEAEAKAITIESILEPIFGYVVGDEERLQQAIGNLLSNAIKFTPEGGRIQVKLRSLNDSVQVQVRDTGQGIRAEFLPYVFDLFRQGVRTGHEGGLGLGLAIARHLIELQGGTIEADSPGEGKGATFTLKLPLVDDDC